MDTCSSIGNVAVVVEETSVVVEETLHEATPFTEWIRGSSVWLSIAASCNVPSTTTNILPFILTLVLIPRLSLNGYVRGSSVSVPTCARIHKAQVTVGV